VKPPAPAPRPSPRAGRAAEPGRPKRRRSAVYDADGAEVFITLMCLKCHKMRPLAQFGLRKMADGSIRNQPWCRPCRSAAGAPRGRVVEPTETVEATETAESLATAAAVAPAGAAERTAEPQARDPQLAAKIAAALAAGLGR
jgi:hypothetical protein